VLRDSSPTVAKDIISQDLVQVSDTVNALGKTPSFLDLVIESEGSLLLWL
jgi:hypothetical protein